MERYGKYFEPNEDGFFIYEHGDYGIDPENPHIFHCPRCGIIFDEPNPDTKGYAYTICKRRSKEFPELLCPECDMQKDITEYLLP